MKWERVTKSGHYCIWIWDGHGMNDFFCDLMQVSWVRRDGWRSVALQVGKRLMKPHCKWERDRRGLSGWDMVFVRVGGMGLSVHVCVHVRNEERWREGV